MPQHTDSFNFQLLVEERLSPPLTKFDAEIELKIRWRRHY